ncbi:hypothetical protein [Thauera mechernichensis]
MRNYACLALLFLTAGCATGPVYENFNGSGASCIKGGMANVFKFYADADAHVSITHVDGVASKSGFSTVCVAPGVHTLRVNAVTLCCSSLSDLALEINENKSYKINAQVRKIDGQSHMAFAITEEAAGGLLIVEERFAKITGGGGLEMAVPLINVSPAMVSPK